MQDLRVTFLVSVPRICIEAYVDGWMLWLVDECSHVSYFPNSGPSDLQYEG